MSKFLIFNIQLLPNQDGIAEVGRSGYRRLFSKLNELNKAHLRENTHTSFHYQLPADTFIGPKEFKFPSGYVFGYFVRYTKAEKITELRTGKTLFKAPRSGAGVVGILDIPFVFDTDRHLLAIDGINLPRTEVFIECLQKYLLPVQEINFPDHELTVNLISKPNAIERVFESATSYKVVDLTVSFQNGHATDQLLKELKDSKTHQLKLHASAGTKGQMSKLPEFIKDLLRAASSVGFSRVTYFVPLEGSVQGATKKQTFDSREAPLTMTARHSASDVSEEDFFARVAGKLDELNIESSSELNSQTSPEKDREDI